MALELNWARAEAEAEAQPAFVGRAPGMNVRQAKGQGRADGRLPGRVRNEHGEWEDEESYRRRGEEAKNSIACKILRARRLFLQEISRDPGKRAAFEILTELPIDWDKAANLKAQCDEPYRTANQRHPDMILTAESGWSFGEIGYGEDKKAKLRKALDAHRAEQGLEPIDWDEPLADDEEDSVWPGEPPRRPRVVRL